jgi:hypothetical protein
VLAVGGLDHAALGTERGDAGADPCEHLVEDQPVLVSSSAFS